MRDKDLIEALRDIVAQYRSMTEALQEVLSDLEKVQEKTPEKTADFMVRKGGR